MKQKGFTLIELLVVISIIGLLASVVLVALNGARAKARDVKRIADLRQVMNALALYYDANGSYPTSVGALSPNVNWSNSNDASWTTLQTLLSTYVAKLPIDPKQDPTGYPGINNYSYAYFSDNSGTCAKQGYMLLYKLENASGPDPGVTLCGTFYQYGGAGANTQIKTGGVSK